MPDNPALDQFIVFFEADVLHLYKNHPDKYVLDLDEYGGEIRITEAYYYKHEFSGRLKVEYFEKIRFANHKKKDGKPCIGVFVPDLINAPDIERKKWDNLIVHRSLLVEKDERFEKWHERFIQGSWNVPIEPRKQLSYIIKQINACCKTLVGESLYTAVPDNSIIYPISPDTHAYEEAHQRLYGFLVDSLSKKCLLELANLRNKTILEADNMKPPTLLRHVFCEFDKKSKLHTLLAEVSKQRSKPSHGVRDAAKESNAFENFKNDLEIAVDVYEELLELIESEFSVSAEHELKRHDMINFLPKITGDVHQLSSTRQAAKMQGKTIEKVSYGRRKEIEGVQQCEVLFFQFTTGEILTIDTVSNIGDMVDETDMKPDELRVEFGLKWVDAPSNKNEDTENSD